MAVDLIHNGMGQGDLANYMLNNSSSRLDPGTMRPYLHFNEKTGAWGVYITAYKGGDAKNPKNYVTQQIQTNANTLRRDEWKQLDDAVLRISETRLNGVQDLISKGLTYTLGNAMGTTVLEWTDTGDAMEANVSMDGISRSTNDRQTFQHNYLPIPIIHVDYEINARVLATSRTMGNSLDTLSAERAARKVADKLESMLFTDDSYSWGETDSRSRNSIYSYVNFPDREKLTITSWTASGKTGVAILNDVLAAKQKSINAKHFGPWTLYIPTAWETTLDEDYVGSTPDTNATGKSIRERILAIANINDIKVIDTLTADNALLVQMTPDVVRLVQGMGIQNIQWQTEGNFVNKYKVMTIQVPQLRSDRNGKTGIVHMATSF
jgi:hypothetical protein